jgi:hypothetical protein
MKLKVIIGLSFLLLLSIIGGCKKKVAGAGGKNSITGSVLFKNGVSGINDPATKARVSIAYGTKEVTSAFDQTILTDADGSYKFEGLNNGDYFIKAEYTDANGFNYNDPGISISFENKKKNLEVNIILE